MPREINGIALHQDVRAGRKRTIARILLCLECHRHAASEQKRAEQQDARSHSPNENKMSDGGRWRASLGVEVWKSSQKWSVQRSAVRSIAWLGLFRLNASQLLL